MTFFPTISTPSIELYKIKACFLIVILLLLSSCQTIKTDPNYNRPISLEQIEKVQVGMGVVEVLKVLGSSAINDALQPKKLIYLFLVDDKPYKVEVAIDEQNKVEKISSKATSPRL